MIAVTPAELRRELEYAARISEKIPSNGRDHARFSVAPRDREGRTCAAWRADHYWVRAYYTNCNGVDLGPLEAALKGWPGVYRTTQVVRRKIHDSDWPDRHRITDPYLRDQVWALVR
jgi:hypothetical protein